MIRSLAFVPPDLVEDCYQHILEYLSRHAKLFKSLDAQAENKINAYLRYLERTFLGGTFAGEMTSQPTFQTSLWNKHEETVEEMPRTNNSNEGWNSAWNRDIGPYRNLFTIITELIRRATTDNVTAAHALAQVIYNILLLFNN